MEPNKLVNLVNDFGFPVVLAVLMMGFIWYMFKYVTNELKPKVVVCENVKGLTMTYAKEHLQRIVNDFEKCGYTTVFRVMKGQY